jgi:uncharacterized protein (DUF1499 family)
MITKCYSYFEVKLYDIFIGYATITYYYYNGHQNDKISTLFVPYPEISSIPNIKLTDQWPTYFEDDLETFNLTQDEQLTTNLLKKIIFNLIPGTLSFIKNREAFYLDINKNGTIHKCFLVHEFYLKPQSKHVQLLADNRVFKFDINTSDSELQNTMISLI